MFENRKKVLSFLLSALMIVSVMFGSVGSKSAYAKAEAVTANSYGLAENAKDGAILQAFCWSFKQIEDNLDKIANAGFTTVQTSAVQNCPSGSVWWLVYQPTDFKVGNQLGSESELKTLCSEADKYGIKIICDVVPNHTTSRSNGVAGRLNRDDFYHNKGYGIDYSNRWQIIQKDVDNGLPDLNTENYDLQNIEKNYLNQLVADGVDGFRFDCAKHIGLPDDNGGGNFWPNVLGGVNNRNNLFIYGECLQDSYNTTREVAYSQYMSITASDYGYAVRNAVTSHNIGAANISDYCGKGTDPDKIVTWAESHDNWENYEESLNSWQKQMAYIICDCRAQGTPMFFNRASTRHDNRKLAQMGDDAWEDVQVIAANKFRNAMVGEGEYNRVISNNLMQIDRGTKGTALICLDGDTSINNTTTLADGTYVDQTGINGTFNVSGGRLTGNIKSGTTAMLYHPQAAAPSVKSSVKSGTEFKSDSLNVTLSLKNAVSGTYQVDSGDVVTFTGTKKITIGESADYGSTITLKLTATNGTETTNAAYTYKKVKSLVIEKGTALLKLPSGWSTPKIYVYNDSGSALKKVADWPGVAMTKMSSLGDGYYGYTLPDGWSSAKVIFNDGTNQVPGTMQSGFEMTSDDIKIYKDGSWQDYTIS